MRCPTCDVEVIGVHRLGLRSGYCPECEGEWFAKGALDELLARAVDDARRRRPEESDGWTRLMPVQSPERREGLWNWF